MPIHLGKVLDFYAYDIEHKLLKNENITGFNWLQCLISETSKLGNKMMVKVALHLKDKASLVQSVVGKMVIRGRTEF